MNFQDFQPGKLRQLGPSIVSGYHLCARKNQHKSWEAPPQIFWFRFLILRHQGSDSVKQPMFQGVQYIEHLHVQKPKAPQESGVLTPEECKEQRVFLLNNVRKLTASCKQEHNSDKVLCVCTYSHSADNLLM